MKYWALKTREDWNRRSFCDHWNDFRTERVIAIGWEKIGVVPDRVSLNEIKAEIQKVYGKSDRGAASNANTIQKFVNLSPSDRVLICQGYAPNQRKKVHLYGIATVTGLFEDHDSKGWRWRFRHKANIEPFGENGKDVSKEFLVQRLGNGSLLQTLHAISKEGFERVVEDIVKR